MAVHPIKIGEPKCSITAAWARALATINDEFPMNSGASPSLNEPAFAAITCSSGPPCEPGKTDLSIPFACADLQRIRPPRGPRSVLWVVDVTTSACGTGDG